MWWECDQNKFNGMDSFSPEKLSEIHILPQGRKKIWKLLDRVRMAAGGS